MKYWYNSDSIRDGSSSDNDSLIGLLRLIRNNSLNRIMIIIYDRLTSHLIEQKSGVKIAVN